MSNKRGWIRIFEAVIAILLLLGFVMFIINRQTEKVDFSGSVHTLLSTVLDEASGNLNIREAVFEKDNATVINFISSRLPAGLNFTINICNATGPCLLPIIKPGVEIYADDLLISTNLVSYAPTKLAIFAWIEPRVPEEYVPVVTSPTITPLTCPGTGSSYNFTFESEACKPTDCNNFYSSLTQGGIKFNNAFYTELCTDGDTDCTFTNCIVTLIGGSRTVTTPLLNNEKYICLKKSDGTCKMKIKRIS